MSLPSSCASPLSPPCCSHGAGRSAPRSSTSALPASVSTNSLCPSSSWVRIRPSSSHCARAGPPQAAAALLDLLHDLVAVAWLLGEQQQRGGADVPASRAPTASARAAAAERRSPSTATVVAVRAVDEALACSSAVARPAAPAG